MSDDWKPSRGDIQNELAFLSAELRKSCSPDRQNELMSRLREAERQLEDYEGSQQAYPRSPSTLSNRSASSAASHLGVSHGSVDHHRSAGGSSPSGYIISRSSPAGPPLSRTPSNPSLPPWQWPSHPETPSPPGPPGSHHSSEESSQPGRKRLREPNSDFTPGNARTKVPKRDLAGYLARPDSRQSNVSTQSGSSLPEDVLIALGYESREQARELMRQQQRAQDEIDERQRADEEFARQLQAQFDADGPSSSFNENSSAGPRSQAYMNTDGTINRVQPLLPSRPAPGPESGMNNFPSPFQPAMGQQQPLPRPVLPPPPNMIQQQPSYNLPLPNSFDNAAGRHTSTSSSVAAQPPSIIVIDSDSDEEPFFEDPPDQRWDRTTSFERNREAARAMDARNRQQLAQRMAARQQAQYHGAGGSSVYGNSNPAGTSQFSWSNVMQTAESLRENFRSLINPGAYGNTGVGSSSVGGSIFPEWMGTNNLEQNEPDEFWRNQNEGYRGDGDISTETVAQQVKDLMQNISPDKEYDPNDCISTPEGMADDCELYPHQSIGLSWMSKMEKSSNKGGILADDMGLGKTIQAIALILANRSEDPEVKTTLIVAPVALLRQWESEIEAKVKRSHRLKTFIYHGNNKKGMTWAKLKDFDVVLTTYGTVSSEFSLIERWREANGNDITALQPRLLFFQQDTRFFRIILDEAQNIKNKATKAARSATSLKAKHRFCMTGTPMMNGVQELFSLVQFLRIAPYNNWNNFNAEFVKPLGQGYMRGSERAMQKLQVLLKAILLRRTKKSTIGGKPIISLPERVTTVDHAVFDRDQQEFYDALEQKTRVAFNRFRNADAVGRNYSSILVLLLRLRQACCHPYLIKGFADEGGAEGPRAADLERIARELLAPEVVARIKDGGVADCAICMDAAGNARIFTPCGHYTCSECFVRVAESGRAEDSQSFRCFQCRGQVDPEKVTDWENFKVVHAPELIEREEGEDEGDEDGSETEGGSESEAEEENEDETLGGFIVDDDGKVKKAKPVKDSEVSDSDVEAKEDDGALDMLIGDSSTKVGKRIKDEEKDGNASDGGKPEKPKKKKRKSKGKGKDKPKKKDEKSMAELQREAKRNLKAKRKYFEKLNENWETSAKVEKCMEILDEIMADAAGEKIIVFSQFTAMLDLLEIPLIARQWEYERYDGSMSAAQRNDAVEAFARRSRCRLVLVSLKAGNAGLNLTCANHVVLFDPFWNPFIEEQAVDRAHRIGQRRAVRVYRLLVQGTVEDRILALQEKKRTLIDGALNEKAARNVSRLSQRDLEYLFGVRS